MKVSEAKAERDWDNFTDEKILKNYPRWPNEILLKIVFGSYLKNKIQLKKKSKILDIGCGFGNNLLPFIVKDHDCYGTEITDNMSKVAEMVLKDQGYSAKISKGVNRDLPFTSNYFDLLLSINVIHYEKLLEHIKESFEEYNRVLKKDSRLILFTVAPQHDIQVKAKKVKDNNYVVQNFDFRDGTPMFFFDTKEYLRDVLQKQFYNIEIEIVTEKLMNVNLEFFVVSAFSKK